MPPAIREKALAVGPQIVETLRRGHDAGLKIAFGTDTAVSPHGENAREFALMVQAGMTSMEAIVAATVTAAEHIGAGGPHRHHRAGQGGGYHAQRRPARSTM